MRENQNLRQIRLSRIIRKKIMFSRDPVLPILEDKFHAKVLASLFGVPAVPLLFHCRKPIRFKNFLKTNADRMPDFVVKTNHGAGDVCIVRKVEPGIWRINGEKLNETGPIDILSGRLAAFLWKQLRTIHSTDEWAVNMIWPRRILVEPYIETNDDYKVMVTNGKAVFTYCTTGRFSEQGGASGVFDREWRLRGALQKTIERHGKVQGEQLLRNCFPKPENLSSLYRFAELLAPSHLTMQRVDFYKTADGRFLMGEVTSYSAGGTESMALEENAELELSKLITDRPISFHGQNKLKVTRLDNDGGEDENSPNAFKRAYLAVIHGADIVLHADSSSSREDISELIRDQRNQPGTLNRRGSSWSWDKHRIFMQAGEIMNNKISE